MAPTISTPVTSPRYQWLHISQMRSAARCNGIAMAKEPIVDEIAAMDVDTSANATKSRNVSNAGLKRSRSSTSWPLQVANALPAPTSTSTHNGLGDALSSAPAT